MRIYMEFVATEAKERKTFGPDEEGLAARSTWLPKPFLEPDINILDHDFLLYESSNRVICRTVVDVHVMRVRVAVSRLLHEALSLSPSSFVHRQPKLGPGIPFRKNELEGGRKGETGVSVPVLRLVNTHILFTGRHDVLDTE